MSMADRIGVMNGGRLVQVAAPAEIYEQPASRWVAEFIGDVNLLEGKIVESGPTGTIVETKAAGRIAAAAAEAIAGDAVAVAIRPEKIAIARERPAGDGNAVNGTVSDIGYLGDVSLYKIRLADGTAMKATAANRARRVRQEIGEGDAVWLSFPADAGVVLTR
jgi:putrescine transport system ATP-binding protein